jgi:CheY-like chemotaxis protein
MRERIKSWGYDLIEARSGEEAINLLRQEKPDIIVLDYLMPKMDGVMALKEIRNINIDIPVIMFTAYPDGKAIEGTEELGISAFVPKLSTYVNSQAALRSALNMAVRKLGNKE